MGLRDTIISRAMGSVSALNVRSALNPALWLCGIVTIPALVASPWFANVPDWLIVIAFIPVTVASLGFIFLLLFDRDKLQSENFQIRKQSLELIEQKGDLRPIDATTIEAIANPDYPALPSEKSGDES
jgi:hypothetical protein